MKKVLGININLSAVSWALADRAESDSETGALLRAGVRVPNISPVEKLAFARGDAAATNLQRKEQRVIRRMRNRVTGNQEYIKIGNEATSKIATIVHQKR